MTEQETPATAEPSGQVAMPEKEITFRDRQMWVRLPGPEQLLVWRRTLTKLQGANVEGWNGEQVMTALERVRKILDSVLVHEVDRDWLDDEMLGGLGLREIAPILQLTIEAFASDDNRESRRAAKKAPAKKAARKKAAR